MRCLGGSVSLSTQLDFGSDHDFTVMRSSSCGACLGFSLYPFPLAHMGSFSLKKKRVKLT